MKKHTYKVLSRRFSQIATFFLRAKTQVYLDNDKSSVGYTLPPKANKAIEIHVSRTHSVFEYDRDGKKMTEERKEFMWYGVTGHEMLHHKYSPFTAEQAITKSLPKREQQYFHDLWNIGEDAAIEGASDLIFGGTLEKALLASIQHFYDVSPNIDENVPEGDVSYAYQQVANALIQLGDRGPVKGKFQTPEAEEVFHKVEPVFWKMVKESDGIKRLDYAMEMFELTRPLWSNQQTKSELSGMSPMMSGGDGEPLPSRGNQSSGASCASDDEEESKGEKTGGSSNKSDDTDNEKGSGSGSKGQDADNSSEKKKTKDKNGSGKKSKPKDDSKEDGKSASGKKPNDKDESSSESADSRNTDAEKSEDTDTGEDDSKDFKDGKGGKKSDDADKESDDEEDQTDSGNKNADTNSEKPEWFKPGDGSGDERPEITEEDLKAFDEELEEIQQEIERENKEEAERAELEDMDVPVNNDQVEHVKRDPWTVSDKYDEMIAGYLPRIQSLARELQSIFRNDVSGKKNSEHGTKVNVKRISDGKLHSKIMVSHTNPKDVSNMAVYLLVDESGSMHGDKILCARDTAMCLYEALNELKIPVAITGFSTTYSKACHEHFVTWHSAKNAKTSLLRMAAGNCNYDYWSIAEAGKELQKCNAAHKLLIVLSDGAPCTCSAQGINSSALDLTKASINRNRKNGISVLGVAISPSNRMTYAAMYGKDYIVVNQPNDMFIQIATKMKSIVKDWTVD